MVASSLVFAVSLALFAGQRPGVAAPSNSDISYIEDNITLPADAPGPLPTYERYYAWTIDNGKKYIYGVYIFSGLLNVNDPRARPGRIHPVTEDEIPNVTNGGCGVITFYFDPRRSHMPSLYCNAVGPTSAP